MSIRKPGSPTCWPGFQITPPTKSPTCFHGIGRRTNSSRPPLLPERFAADYRACLGCWPDAYKALRTERDPDSPDEGLTRSVDRDLDTAADEKQFVVDHAGVGLQNAAVLSLLLRDPVEI